MRASVAQVKPGECMILISCEMLDKQDNYSDNDCCDSDNETVIEKTTTSSQLINDRGQQPQFLPYKPRIVKYAAQKNDMMEKLLMAILSTWTTKAPLRAGRTCTQGVSGFITFCTAFSN